MSKFKVQSTDELRMPAAVGAPVSKGCSGELKILKYKRHFLPNLPLRAPKTVSAICRRDFDARSLRDVADYVCDCDSDPGTRPDDYQTLLTERTGTIGAKQSLLAILAEECGRPALQLIVACCEMPVTGIQKEGCEINKSPTTLPLAVCWLKYRGRRLQIGESSRGGPRVVKPITEVRVTPAAFLSERIRLYKSFAEDWCRALDVAPGEFARLRTRQLHASAGTAQFEDLLGYCIAADYEPSP